MKKNNKDLMCVYERYNKRKELSYELHCSGKDPLTKKFKVYIKTYKVPSNLTTQKEKDQFRLQCQIEWQEEVKARSQGLDYSNNKITFCDYTQRWLDKMLKFNKEAYNHYANCKSNMAIFKEMFGNYTLQEMNRPVINKFFEWLCTRTYTKETIIVREDLRKIIKDKHLTITETAKRCGISECTLRVALTIGEHINVDTKNKICEVLEINPYEYFDIIKQKVQYSSSANHNLKAMLSAVLNEAVRDGIITINYAKSEYHKPVTGACKKKEIYDSIEEIQQFIKCLEKEEDIRKKVAFSIAINMGMRSAEIAGLSWEDIDFDNKVINISKNTMYVYGFGVVTKGTKNNSSTRTISMPDNLINVLEEYKIWWEKEKAIHHDWKNWKNTTKLFVQANGNDMSNTTLGSWLKEFQEKYNLKRVTMHGLRHSNITMLILNGADMKTVSSRAGHNNIQTTLNIYSHYTKEADKKASDTINQLLYATN